MKTKKRPPKNTSLSFNRIIQNFFKEGEPLPGEITNLRFEIRAQIYENNVPTTITGRIFDNIETVVDDLAKEVGSGKYRLFVRVYNSLDEMTGMTKVEDFRIVSRYAAPAPVVQKTNTPEQPSENLGNILREINAENQRQIMGLVTTFTGMIANMKMPAQSQGNALSFLERGIKIGKQVAGTGIIIDDDEEIETEEVQPVSPMKQGIMDVLEVVREVMPLLTGLKSGGEAMPAGLDKLLDDPKIKKMQELLDKNPELLQQLENVT